MLRLQYFAPGDVIVRQGEAGDTILFVTKGHLEVRWYYNDEEQDFSDEDIAFKAVMHKLQAPDSPRPSDAQLSATSTPCMVCRHLVVPMRVAITQSFVPLGSSCLGGLQSESSLEGGPGWVQGLHNMKAEHACCSCRRPMAQACASQAAGQLRTQ